MGVAEDVALLELELRPRFISADERPVGEGVLSLFELALELFEVCELLTILLNWTFVVCAIWPQPWPWERNVKRPGS